MNVSDTPSFDNPQKPKFLQKTSSFCSDFVIFFGGTLLAFLLIWSLWCLTSPPSPPSSFSSSLPSQPPPKPDPTTFYDDPDLGYTINTRVQNWDDKRKQWLNLHPEFSGSETERVVMVTGSQPKMFSYWAKYPVVKAAMIAHPEAEWIWWVDSDAFITDMDFNLPLEKYKTHNLIIHGWDHLVFQKKSWTGLNAGVFLIRNCQWSMDLLERWVKFGPSSPEYEKWGEIQKSIFKDKSFPEADDQTGIAYIMVKEGDKWNEKIYLEKEYYFEGYWLEIVDKLENITAYYSKIEKRERRLRRKNGEKAGKDYRAQWEEIREKEMGIEMKRPFITHFTGCEPCSGKHNEKYSREACLKGMNMALNFGDNQVLRNFGYIRPYLGNTSFVEPIRL